MWPFRSYPLIDESAEPDAFRQAEPPSGVAPVVIKYDDLPNYDASSGYVNNQIRWGWDDGEKFQGGFGPTLLLFKDYWTLRARSAELFGTNLYARGLIRRLITNEINTGLHLESTPDERILGIDEDILSEWTEDVETRFELWSSVPKLCDASERATLGTLQAEARMEALIAGDVLVVMQPYAPTGIRRVQLVGGSLVRSGLGQVPQAGNKIVEGVEIDPQGRHVAFWVYQEDGAFKRLPAYGEKSGRRLAWLVYGTDKRMEETRGTPMLGLVLQSLKEIDRYRDSTLRKAVLNAMLAMFIEKEQAAQSSMPITGGAVRKGVTNLLDDDAKAPARNYKIMDLAPGLVIEELQVGERIKGGTPNGTDEKFGTFEEAVIQAVAWAYEIPPEILRLSFSSNYSASQAAINEFKMYLNKVRGKFGDEFCQPIYVEWLITQAQQRKINARKLLDAWRNPSEWETYAAWISADWAGAIKPAVDLSKLVGGYEALVLNGAITRDRMTRELTGMKHSKVVKKLKRENAELAEANMPLSILKAAEKARGDAAAIDEEEGADADDPDSESEDGEQGEDADTTKD